MSELLRYGTKRYGIGPFVIRLEYREQLPPSSTWTERIDPTDEFWTKQTDPNVETWTIYKQV